MKKLMTEWRKYITEGKCGNSWCESDQECVDGECVDPQPEPPEESPKPIDEAVPPVQLEED